MFVPQKNANKKLPKKALSVASVKGHKIMSEKMKIKDLAQELGINVKELQKDCSKLNIEATKSTLTEDDVQKIKEYRQAHANDKIEQRETESGVIVRRRKTEPAKAETKKEENKPAEAKADAQKTAADEQTEKTEKAERGGFVSAPAKRAGYFNIRYGRFHCFVYFAQFQSFKL